MILNINKPLGITSFDVIKRLKKLYPGQKIGHAGTLDPLAEGVLICLVGKESTKRQSEFMGAEKEYEFEVLFGFKTDSFDILGMVESSSEFDVETIKSGLSEAIKSFEGEADQTAPKFSALKVSGKPLYRAVLSKSFDPETLPTRKINISEINLLDTQIILKEDLQNRINNLIALIKFGFRQEEILKKWNEVFAACPQTEFLLAKIHARVSKGTYVRAIANDLGDILGVNACTTVIKRTRVGDFKIEDAQVVE